MVLADMMSRCGLVRIASGLLTTAHGEAYANLGVGNENQAR